MTTIATTLTWHFERLAEKLPSVPNGVEWLLPLQDVPESWRVFSTFLKKYYGDNNPRSLILGINPGRFGAGVTNIAFTDPVHLERECGIANTFPKREELSAQFVYRVVSTLGGTQAFYRRFFINSVVPFGFVKAGKNYNYYDEKPLQQAVAPFAVYHLRGLLDAGMGSETCFCLGEGKNYAFLSKLNEREKIFEKIVPLPHPRFIMQYRRKSIGEFVKQYVEVLR
jgi:hypothetical protein